MFTNQKSNDTEQLKPAADPILQKGSSGNAVVTLQQLLNTCGYGLVVDGLFGQATERAVIQFQQRLAIIADGIVGTQTWKALRQANQPIMLTETCRYYDPFNYPHQTAALIWLQQQIPGNVMAEFSLRWRNHIEH
ncbi:peptidoglycan-binding domain-containing protein [Leptolyngbya ohadii]|uniref:peptidoglycan-binding domain-containing protein n=1 Tax=Leptolyngbya ohadii TaxID=1962290 RepID=UPI000B5A0303|nr:peptidoglycan-binding domain-containing protein [Leptolyngbya ohadii]